MQSKVVPSPLARATKAYRVPKPAQPVDLKLDSNEGVPAVEASELELVGETLCRYPNRAPLQARIAELHRITPDRVLITAGGDEALERACRSVLGQSDRPPFHRQ